MKRLTKYKREQIAVHTTVGLSVREIARRIGRDHSVVSRELQRNKSQLFAYEAASAQYCDEQRKPMCGRLRSTRVLSGISELSCARNGVLSKYRVNSRTTHPRSLGVFLFHTKPYTSGFMKFHLTKNPGCTTPSGATP